MDPRLGAAKRTGIAVIVCSVGRPRCVEQLAQVLARQTRLADEVVFVGTGPSDIDFDPAPILGPDTESSAIFSPKGLARQRNAGLDAIAEGHSIVVFFDDDFIPSRFALEQIEKAFALWPSVNGMTGHLIADGIHGEGYSHADAVAMVDQWDAQRADDADRAFGILGRGLTGLYGCNMAYRLSAIGALRFDERLPLYGWQEDIDFSARLPGERIKTDALAGVHMGIKSGRETAGVRLGYSQMVNPWYLWRKGSMPARFALKLTTRNLAANHLKVLKPEPWIDRRGRMCGNWRGILDILSGRADPERILTM